MDLSKADDQQLRIVALQWAHSLAASPNGCPECLIEDARDIYLFLTGQDPVIDILGDDDCDNVISFRDFVKNLDMEVTLYDPT